MTPREIADAAARLRATHADTEDPALKEALALLKEALNAIEVFWTDPADIYEAIGAEQFRQAGEDFWVDPDPWNNL